MTKYLQNQSVDVGAAGKMKGSQVIAIHPGGDYKRLYRVGQSTQQLSCFFNIFTCAHTADISVDFMSQACVFLNTTPLYNSCSRKR